MCAMPERTSFTYMGAGGAGWVVQVKIPGSKESVQLKGAAAFPWPGRGVAAGRHVAEGALGMIWVHAMLGFGHWEVVLGGNVQLPLASTWIPVLVSSLFRSPNVLVEFLVLVFDKLN